MYKVYCDKELIYDLDSDLNVLISPKLDLELNKAPTLEFTMPPGHPFYDKIDRFKSIFQVLQDGTEIFKGRAIQVQDDMYKQRYVYCEGELAYLNDTIQRPAEFHLDGDAVYRYLQLLLESHNAQVDPDDDYNDPNKSKDDAPRVLELGMVKVEDPNDYLYRYTNYNSTMQEIKEDLVDDIGGYIRVRNVYANNNPLGTLQHRYLDYIGIEEYGETSEQYIEFGENLLDYLSDIDQTDICTGIIPLGAILEDEESEFSALETRLTIEDVNEGSDYLVIPEAVEKYGLILKTVTWDDVTIAENLKKNGEAYLQTYEYDNMVIEATALDLHLTDEEIAAWRLGDMIFVRSTPHNLAERFPLAQMSIPLDSPESTTVTLGTFTDSSLTAKTNTTQSGLRNFEDFSTGNIIKSAVAQATALIQGATHGYVTLNWDEDGRPFELLIMDAPEVENAKKLWRWNMGGLGYTDGGYEEGEYALAMTMDGHILGTLLIANGAILADDRDVEFAKFDDTGMKIYAQAGRDDLMLMSIGREGLTLYDDTGKNVLASFYSDGVKIYGASEALLMNLFSNGLTLYNANGSVLMLLNTSGITVNNSSETTLMTLNQYGLRLYDTGGALRSSLDSDSFDVYDSSENPMMRMNTNGAQYYYNGDLVGTIGTSYWVGYPNNRGLTLNLEYGSAYMAFGWKESSNASSYTAMIAFHTNSSSEPQGVHFGDNLLLNNYKQYFGASLSGAYLQADSGGGLIIDGGTLYIQQTGYYQGDEIAGQQWVLDQIQSGGGGGDYVTSDQYATLRVWDTNNSGYTNVPLYFGATANLRLNSLVSGGGEYPDDIECSSVTASGKITAGAVITANSGIEISSGELVFNNGYMIASDGTGILWGSSGTVVNLGATGSTINIGPDSSCKVNICGSSYSSDQRLKTSIQPLTTSALDNLTPVSFKWRDGDDKTHYGYIAQEVQPYFPELVSEGTGGMLGLAYIEIIPLLHCKIKEMDETIKAQQSKIESLEERIAKLEALING